MADRFDLDAIEADDALLDLLAAGGESARAAGEHDPAVKLLAELRLAVEVEDELPVETIDDPESFLARCAALNPVTDPFARKMAARGLALGVAAVAALSVSGVAAAVNGDPLSPYEKVIEKIVDAVRPQTSFPKEQLDGMPVVDKTKIVKVAKNYQKKQEEKAAGRAGPRPKSDPIRRRPWSSRWTSRRLRWRCPRCPSSRPSTPIEPPVGADQAPEQTDDETTGRRPGRPADPTDDRPEPRRRATAGPRRRIRRRRRPPIRRRRRRRTPTTDADRRRRPRRQRRDGTETASTEQPDDPTPTTGRRRRPVATATGRDRYGDAARPTPARLTPARPAPRRHPADRTRSRPTPGRGRRPDRLTDLVDEILRADAADADRCAGRGAERASSSSASGLKPDREALERQGLAPVRSRQTYADGQALQPARTPRASTPRSPGRTARSRPDDVLPDPRRRQQADPDRPRVPVTCDRGPAAARAAARSCGRAIRAAGAGAA